MSSHSKTKGKIYRTYLLAMMVAIYACNFMDRMIISVVSQDIKAEFKLSDLQVGVLGGFAFAAFYSVGAIPLARLADHKNRLTIITVCLAAWSIFTSIGGVAQSYAQLLLSRIGVGIGEAGLVAPAHSLLADEFRPEHRPLALSVFSLGPPLGIMMGGILGGMLTQAYGWRAALIIIGFPGLALAALARYTLREPKRGQWDGAPSAAQNPSSLRCVMVKIWATPTLALICITGILTNFAGFGIFPFLPSYLMRKYGVSAAEAGLAIGLLVGLGGGLGSLIGGPIAQFVQRRSPRLFLAVPACGFVISVPFLITGFSQEILPTAILLFVVPEVLRYTWLGPGFSTVSNLIRPRERASAVAIIYLFMSMIGMGLGPVFSGALSDYFGAANYTGNSFAADCMNTQIMSALCNKASIEGLRLAMIASSAVFGLAGGTLFFASLRLPYDLEKAKHSIGVLEKASISRNDDNAVARR